MDKNFQDKILYSSIEFTHELLTNEDHYDALSNGLKILGNATQVDRVYYWENHYDKKSDQWLTSQKFEWCLGNIDQQIDNPELQNIPFEETGYFIEILSQNKSFSAHVKDMDGNSGNTKESLESQGILSILAIPVFIKDEFRGFMGFDSCSYEKEWSNVEISLLQSFIFLYVKALERSFLEKNISQIKDNFNNFFNMINDLLFVLDLEGNIIEVNNTVLEKFNYSKDELLGQAITMLHPKDKLKEVQIKMAKLISKEIDYCNIPAITSTGKIFPVETKVSEGLWNGNKVLFAVSKDISELTMSEEKFSNAFNHSGVSMFISKFENGEILEVNDKLLDYTGYRRDELIGNTTLDLQIIHGFEDRDFIKKEIGLYNKISDLELKITNKSNITHTALVNIVPLNINNETCLLSSIIDISERVEYEEKILEISNRDSLTGIFNRRFVYERAEELLEEYKRNESFFCVSIIDIDDFKVINDNFGHQVGDLVLKDFTKTIGKNLRPYDMLGRYGGEEFIIIFKHSSKKESNLILERILNIIRNKIFTFDDNNIQFTFSGGISCCKELDSDNITIDQLVEIADKKMYFAKINGKNQIVYE